MFCAQTLIGQYPPPISPGQLAVRMIVMSRISSHVKSDISRDFGTHTCRPTLKMMIEHMTRFDLPSACQSSRPTIQNRLLFLMHETTLKTYFKT